MIEIWGIKIHPYTKNQIIKIIDNSLQSASIVFHLTGVNPETISQAQSNTKLRDAINASDLVNIDNTLVVVSLRLLGHSIPERAACPDIFELLLDLSNRKGYTVYFLGAKKEILQVMIRNINNRYPLLSIQGYHDGYYSTEDEESLVLEISRLKPDLLFVALPTPQKELFITKYKYRLGVRFAFGVGGAFDVMAGKVKRAPLWMRNIGLEGTHRALQNPFNYGARYLKYYLPFLRLVLKELLKKGSKPQK